MTLPHGFAPPSSAASRPTHLRLRPRLRAVAFGLSLSFATFGVYDAGVAEAQPSASDKAAAEALFTAGRDALDAGNYAVACEKLEASQQIDPGVGTLLYLGACYEKLGRTASAWATFREASSVAQAAGQDDRADVARERADKLEPQLFRLTVHVAKENDLEGFKLVHGQTALSDATFGVPTPVDPGAHELTASAPGYQSWSRLVSVPTGPGAQTVSVPALVELDAQAPPPPVAPVSTTEVPAAPPPTAAAPGPGPDQADSDAGAGQRTAALVLGGLGVVGLGIGTVFAVVALGNDSDADDVCEDNSCATEEGVALSNDARDAGNGATVGYLVGGVALTAALVLYLTAPSGASNEVGSTGLRWHAGVGPDGGDIWLGGQF